jgi:outer membrane lipopolysaccharide assembly protein LptE/RlpB
MRTFAFALMTAATIATLGCGYHTAGHVSTVPESVRTIAIPAFTNNSPTYRVEQLLTAAVIHEFTTRTNYHIANDPGEGADAVLHGTVTGTSVFPSTYDSQTGRASSVQVSVSMNVTLAGRDGKILFQNPSYLFRQQYQVSQEIDTFFQEDTPALQRLAQQFAQSLVSNILEGF